MTEDNLAHLVRQAQQGQTASWDRVDLLAQSDRKDPPGRRVRLVRTALLALPVQQGQQAALVSRVSLVLQDQWGLQGTEA